MSRSDYFAAILAQCPKERKDIIDLTPITVANPNGYLSQAGDVGPWVPYKCGDTGGGWAQAEYVCDDAGSAVVALDFNSNPNGVCPALDQWRSQYLTVAGPGGGGAGDGLTILSKPVFVRLRLVSISGTNAKVTGHLSGVKP